MGKKKAAAKPAAEVVETKGVTQAEAAAVTAAAEQSPAEFKPMVRPAGEINLFARAVCVDVGFHKPGLVRKVDVSELDISVKDVEEDQKEVDKDMLKVQRTLLDCKEYDQIASYDRQVTKFLKVHAISPSPLKEGVYLIPISMLKQVVDGIKHCQIERQAIVERFIKVYPLRVQEAKQRLRGVFDASFYPTPEQMRKKFGLTYKVFSLFTPDSIKSLSEDLYDQEKARMQEEMKDLSVEISSTLRQGFLEVIQGLVSNLSPTDDGKQRKFYESKAKDLLVFLQTFSAKNIVDDQECATLVETAKKLVSGQSVEKFSTAVRTDEGFRNTMLNHFTKLGKQLESMVEVNEGRMLNI